MNLYNLFENDNSTPNPNYAEELAYQIFKAAPELDSTGSADEVLGAAYTIARDDLGDFRARMLFTRSEDFPGDLVSAYAHLQRQGVTEADPHKFDSDVDYYAALNAPAKRRSAPSDYPYSQEQDDDYFREIFRKKREAAAKAAQDKGVEEGQRWPDTSNSLAKRSAVATSLKGAPANAGRNSGMTVATRVEPTITPTSVKKLGSNIPVPSFLQKGVAENTDVDTSVVVGKLYDIIDHAEDVIKNADFDIQVQKATIVRDRAVKALNMIKQGGNTPDAAAAAFRFMQNGEQGVAEADKKKDDELEPQVKDVALQRAISRAKADFPTAGTGIEALAKDFMRSQDQDSKSFDQIRQAERRQDQMLSKINRIDQEQEQEIQGLEDQNSTLSSRLQQLQNVNNNLEKKLAAMSGRKEKRKDSTGPSSVSTSPTRTSGSATSPAAAGPDTVTPEPTASPVINRMAQDLTAEPSTSRAIGQVAKTLSPPSTAIDQMAQQLQPRQKELPLGEPNVLEPDTKSGRRINTSKAVDAPYRDVSVKMAKKLATDPAMRNQMYNSDALRNLAGQEEMPLENKEQKSEPPEVDYDDPKWDAMVSRVGKLAKEGPRKTVYDPVKRVYKTVPVNK